MKYNYTSQLPSRIEVLTEVMETNARGWTFKFPDAESDHHTGLFRQNVLDELTTIWLPIFKTLKTLEMALESLASCHEDQIVQDFCHFYLKTIQENYASS